MCFAWVTCDRAAIAIIIKIGRRCTRSVLDDKPGLFQYGNRLVSARQGLRRPLEIGKFEALRPQLFELVTPLGNVNHRIERHA